MKHKTTAYTFIEVLIVMALTFILSGFIFAIYKNFLTEEVRHRTSIKKEMDLGSFLIYLEKTISSAGFGLDCTQLKIWTSAGCNKIDNFNNASVFVGIAKNCSTYNIDELYIKSYAISPEKLAGCWWIVNKGEITTQAIDKKGEQCDYNNNGTCVIMDYSKDNPYFLNCADAGSTSKTGIMFYKPHRVSYRFYLTPTDSKECAPSTYTFEIQGTSSQPIFDCVGGFKARYIATNGTYTDSLSDVTQLYGVKICLLIQVSGKMSVPQDVPVSSGCGNFTVGSSEWKYYRWRIIEKDIPFKNL